MFLIQIYKNISYENVKKKIHSKSSTAWCGCAHIYMLQHDALVSNIMVNFNIESIIRTLCT